MLQFIWNTVVFTRYHTKKKTKTKQKFDRIFIKAWIDFTLDSFVLDTSRTVKWLVFLSYSCKIILYLNGQNIWSQCIFIFYLKEQLNDNKIISLVSFYAFSKKKKKKKVNLTEFVKIKMMYSLYNNGLVKFSSGCVPEILTVLIVHLYLTLPVQLNMNLSSTVLLQCIS